MKRCCNRGLAFGCISEDESGNGSFAKELDAVGTGPRFLCPLRTEAGGETTETQYSMYESGRTRVLTLYSAKLPSWIFRSQRGVLKGTFGVSQCKVKLTKVLRDGL